MPSIEPHCTAGASVKEEPAGQWRMQIPPGPTGSYRLAQLDDYQRRARPDFLWQPPLRLSAAVRVSAQAHAGTWGFGLWNDPFSFNLGIAGAGRRLPALPNAAWFFYASPHNYLSFRNDKPAHGMLAATFSAANIPALLLAPGALALPLLFSRFTTPLLRWLLRLFIREDAQELKGNWNAWHTFALEWEAQRVRFLLDDQPVFETEISPHGRLGLVLWIDNQYASLAPGERFKSGALGDQTASWMDIRDLDVVQP